MGIEEDLFNMLKFASPDGTSPMYTLIRRMIRNMELGALKQMKTMVDKMIKEIAKEEAVSGQGDMNPFSILGIDVDATEEEVKKAYRDKAWASHPDRGGSQEKMKRVNAAWEAIKLFKGWAK